MRPSPRRHVLVLIREELGMPQKELIQKLELSPSAVQRIELGSLPLSQKTARKVSEIFGVSLDYLIENNVQKHPVAINGRRWNKEVYERWSASFSPWASLGPEELARRLRYSELLLRMYLRNRSLVESMEDPNSGADLLDAHMERALWEFIQENPKLLKPDGVQEYISKLDNKEFGLESILADVDEVLRVAKKVEGRSPVVRTRPLPPLPKNELEAVKKMIFERVEHDRSRNSPSPPSPENAHREDARRSSSLKRRRPYARATG